jgi:uncharacterized RmlC-like cupin family protein
MHASAKADSKSDGAVAMKMSEWRTGVTVVRAQAQARARLAGAGRATAFDFAGSGGNKTWIGTVTLPPGGKTGGHHHGQHEVAVFVARGRSEIRWGDQLEFAAEVGPGDLIYFAPHVPHQEFNPDPAETVEFVVIRSGNEGFFERLDIAQVDSPEIMF